MGGRKISKRQMNSLPRTTYIACAGAALFFFLIYRHFLAPDIVTGDSADLVAQSYLIGVCHQTGYPITVVAGKLFSFLPVGTVAYRLNMFSAASAAITVMLAALTIRVLLEKDSLAIFGGIVLGFSPVLWSRAESANVHAFAGMLTASYILLFSLFLIRGSRLHFLAGMLVFGLSWTAHMQNLLHLPAIGWLVLTKRNELQPRNLLLGGCLFALGLAPYIWMMHRATVAPPFDTFSSPTTPVSLLYYVLGLSHNPASFSGFGTIARSSLYLLKVYLGSFHIMIPLLIAGILTFWKRNWRISIFLGLIQAANSLYLTNFSYYFSFFHYLIPSCIVSAVWIAAGADAMRDWISRKSPAGSHVAFWTLLAAWAVTAYLIFPSSRFLQWSVEAGCSFPTIDWRRERRGREYINLINERLPENSVIVTSWTYFTLMKYAQYVEGIRPDLALVLHSETDDYRERIAANPEAMAALNSSRPVFFMTGRGIHEIPSDHPGDFL